MNTQFMINETDIKEILKLLNRATKMEDWELVQEAIEYMEDYIPSDSDDNEDY